jgi:hypothetical protein
MGTVQGRHRPPGARDKRILPQVGPGSNEGRPPLQRPGLRLRAGQEMAATPRAKPSSCPSPELPAIAPGLQRLLRRPKAAGQGRRKGRLGFVKDEASRIVLTTWWAACSRAGCTPRSVCSRPWPPGLRGCGRQPDPRAGPSSASAGCCGCAPATTPFRQNPQALHRGRDLERPHRRRVMETLRQAYAAKLVELGSEPSHADRGRPAPRPAPSAGPGKTPRGPWRPCGGKAFAFSVGCAASGSMGRNDEEVVAQGRGLVATCPPCRSTTGA